MESRRTYARPEMVEPLRKELNIPEGATRRETLDILESYAKAHPQLSLRFIAQVSGIPQPTLYSHIHTSKHGKTKAAAKRQLIAEIVARIHPDKEKPILMAPLFKGLKSSGLKLSLNTLRDILKRNGYRTFAVNQNL